MKTYHFPDFVKGGLEFAMQLYSHDEEEHLHDYVELVYIFTGSGIHYVDRIPYHLQRGSMLYINLGQLHRYTVIDNMSYVNFKIKPEYFPDSSKDDGCDFQPPFFTQGSGKQSQMAQLNEKDSEMAEQMIFKMLEEKMHQKEHYKTVIRNNLVNLLVFMQRNFVEQADAALPEPPKNLKKAIAYIDSHCGEKITQEDVCAICYYSPSYLYKALKQYCGCGFSEYLMKKRVNKAMHYLITTEMPIHEIAALTGFSNKTHFYETFKKHIGVQPSFIREYVVKTEHIVQSMLEKL